MVRGLCYPAAYWGLGFLAEYIRIFAGYYFTNGIMARSLSRQIIAIPICDISEPYSDSAGITSPRTDSRPAESVFVNADPGDPTPARKNRAC